MTARTRPDVVGILLSLALPLVLLVGLFGPRALEDLKRGQWSWTVAFAALAVFLVVARLVQLVRASSRSATREKR